MDRWKHLKHGGASAHLYRLLCICALQSAFREATELLPSRRLVSLCKFLGKEIAKDEAFPHVNEYASTLRLHYLIVAIRQWHIGRKYLGWLLLWVSPMDLHAGQRGKIEIRLPSVIILSI